MNKKYWHRLSRNDQILAIIQHINLERAYKTPEWCTHYRCLSTSFGCPRLILGKRHKIGAISSKKNCGTQCPFRKESVETLCKRVDT